MGDVYTNPPQSRNEAILNSIVEGTTYTDPPQSRIEDLLLQVKDVIEEGGHDESATRASIAPTESDSAHASKKIEVGEQFYLSDDKLYTATSPISQGSAIVVYPTASYNCKLSDSVTGQIADRVDWKSNGVLGAKNRIAPTLDLLKEKNTAGTWNGNVYTRNSLTFTVNTDEYGNVIEIVVNNTASATSYFSIYTLDIGSVDMDSEVNPVANGYILSGGSANTPLKYAHGTHNFVYQIDNGTACNNIKLYPMLRLASDTDSTFQPYAQTNRELTVNKADNTVIGTVENGATASQAYAVGEHFTRNGAFCTVTTAITSGETLTEGTNYTSGDVASEFEVTEGEISNVNQNITITQNTNKYFKYGKIINFVTRFTVDTAFSSGTHTLFKLPVPYSDNAYASIMYTIYSDTSPFNAVKTAR